MTRVNTIVGSLLLCLLAFPAIAQITNGAFSQGGNGWTWKRAHIKNQLIPSTPMCESAFQTFTPTWQDVISTAGRSGVAKVGEELPLEPSQWLLCRDISQSVTFPVGKSLKIVYRVGQPNPIGNPPPSIPQNDVLFEVVAQTASQSRKVLLSEVGENRNCTSFCPEFKTKVLDLSSLWGTSGKLRLFSRSGGKNSNTAVFNTPSQAYVDSVEFVDAPVYSGAWPKAGSWYNPERSGHGLNISRSGEYVALSWFTYRSNGSPIWYVSDAKRVSAGIWSSPLYKATRNEFTGVVSLSVIGDIRMDYLSNTDAIFQWDLHTVNGNNAGFDGSEYMQHLFGGGSYTGQWYEASSPGWGINIDYQSNSAGVDTVATVFYFDGSEPAWVQGATEGTPTNGKTIYVRAYTGTNLCPQCGGQASVTSAGAGSISLSLTTSGGTGWTAIAPAGGATWYRGSSGSPLPLSRLTTQ